MPYEPSFHKNIQKLIDEKFLSEDEAKNLSLNEIFTFNNSNIQTFIFDRFSHLMKISSSELTEKNAKEQTINMFKNLSVEERHNLKEPLIQALIKNGTYSFEEAKKLSVEEWNQLIVWAIEIKANLNDVKIEEYWAPKVVADLSSQIKKHQNDETNQANKRPGGSVGRNPLLSWNQIQVGRKIVNIQPPSFPCLPKYL